MYNSTHVKVAIEWDLVKSRANFQKHGVRFADAITALEDEGAVTIRDDHGHEARWVTIGMDCLARVLVVVHTWRGDHIRIISARPATPLERKQYQRAYEEGI